MQFPNWIFIHLSHVAKIKEINNKFYQKSIDKIISSFKTISGKRKFYYSGVQIA